MNGGRPALCWMASTASAVEQASRHQEKSREISIEKIRRMKRKTQKAELGTVVHLWILMEGVE